MEAKLLMNSIQNKFPNEEWILEICRIFNNRTFKQYTTNIYPTELKLFIERHEDNDELLFIDLQLDFIEADIDYIESREPLVNSDDLQVYCDMCETQEDFVRSLKKIKIFLKEQKQELEGKLKTEKPSKSQKAENSLNWNGTQTEFIELIKALIENGNIKGTQTEIISKLSNVFNIEIKHPNKLITDIKIRNNGSETLFLDKLQKSLFDYITLEKKK
jgi:hypothetical protein